MDKKRMSSNETESHIKEEPVDSMEEDIAEEPLAFGPAALGLHRVGTSLPPKPQPQQPIQVLNARGMPARIRKKNKLFFDDDIVNTPLRSPGRRLLKPSTSSTSLSPIKTPSKVLKKRKGVVSKYMRSGGSGNAAGSMADDDGMDDGVSLLQNNDIKMEDDRAVKSITERTPTSHKSKINILSNSKKGTSTPSSIAGDAVDGSSTGQISTPLSVIERKIGQRIGMRLRNLLKLPKAHKWVSFEWFYSFIDKPLFDGDNDFQICLKESYPQLTTRLLTRCEWSKIRRMMGKPRRCSQSFFDEERMELERRRQKIRLLQSRRSADPAYIKDLPNEIPLPLPIDTKVTARLRHPQDGLFTGNVAAFDSLASSYRITFERPGLGTHTIPDYEVLANEFIETIPVSSMVIDRPAINHRQNGSHLNSKQLSVKKQSMMASSTATSGGGLLSSNKLDCLSADVYQMNKFKNLTLPTDTIGGFPLKLLELMIRTKKTLAAKEMKLLRLKHMNAEAEMLKSYGEPITEDFQQRYASIVIGMEKLNRDMQEYLNQIQTHARDLTKEPQVAAMLTPSYLREKCRALGKESVDKNNESIKNESILTLINDLASIMWVASNLTGEGNNSHVLKVLDGCLHEAKNRLNPENVDVFQKHVQVHVRHIELGLVQSSMNTSGTSGTF